MESPIIAYKENLKGIIRLNRPKEYNTFTKELAIILNKSLLQFDKDSQVRVIIIEAEGKHFSTGISLDEFKNTPNAEMHHMISLINQHNHTIANMKKPVISSVKGNGIANGSGLAFASDLVVAASDAVFGTTAIKLGLACLGTGMTLSRHVSRKRLMQFLMTGQHISAIEAYEIGLVNWVVDPGELRKRTIEIADSLIEKNSDALASIKELVYNATEQSYHNGQRYATDIFAQLAIQPSVAIGLDAFANKKKSDWN